MVIENEQTYRTTAEHADGKTGSVTVTTPKELPPPYQMLSQQKKTPHLKLYKKLQLCLKNTFNIELDYYFARYAKIILSK